MRHGFGYFPPDHWYQAVVDRLVVPGCQWIDVGGGKSIFPQNPALAAELANRCGYLVGVDPSENLTQNSLVHERANCLIEEFRSALRFDLATLRMVAEHIESPQLAIEALARVIKPGGHVVVYTPNRWSPSSLAARALPDNWHYRFLRLSSRHRRKEDVFPTWYRMNTRRSLGIYFEQGGFREVAFAYLDDCSLLQRFRTTCFLQLSLWKVLHLFGRRYPESNLLGVYERITGSNEAAQDAIMVT